MFLLLSLSDFRYERLVYETLHPVDFDTSLVIMDILCASEGGNAPDFLDGDSMIVCLFFVPRVCETVSPHRKHTHLKGVKPKFLF